MKAILVIDIPDDADIKALRANFEVYGDIRIKPYYQSNYRVGEGVKLKPMPSFKAVDLNDTRDVVMFCHGWNTCLNEITGETE
jgi:hypothetical protein